MLLRITFFILKRFSFLLILFAVLRVFFYLFHQDYFKQCTWEQIQGAFWLGLRFDASILMTFNLIPLIMICVGRYMPTPKILLLSGKFLFWFVNILLIAFNILDLEYFSFTGKRTGIELLGLQTDILDQVKQLLLHYWDLVLLWFVFVVIVFKHIFHVTQEPVQDANPWKKMLIAMAVFIAVGIITIRGGLQLKPLRPNVAFTIDPNRLGHLALNTPFNFFMTIGIDPIQEVHYFKEDREVRQLLEFIHQPKDTSFSPLKNPNVVILILESFSSEYCGMANNGKGFTPFLDSLASQSLYFPHHFANGRVSMEAVPSILAGIPGLMQEPYITSLYQTNHLVGLGNVLRSNGYETAFFHAAKNGSMGFDAFSKNVGFTKYYGLNEYPFKDRDYDGNWGIYDGPYLQYADSMISEMKPPFAACIFTLSSHQPYSVPKELESKYIPGELKIHRCVSYVDDMLRLFFAKAQTEKWFSNTLFVITADHTHEHSNPAYMNSRGDYQVPLIFYSPTRKLSADTSRVVQQVDIMPSILDLIHIKNEQPALFGQSVFRKKNDIALNYGSGQYRLFMKEFYLEGNLSGPVKVKDYNDQELREATPSETNMLMAFIQYHNNGLIKNNLYDFGE